ncbi:hypothetical protein, partial [Clostridium perfringens]|uniref:hypothetical protein n=1 Tax=Clostridium perfringens TaxID=1502 RepID=UPI003753ED17
PVYVYKIYASRHPPDTVLGRIERDQATTDEVWESEIKYGQSSDAHCHGKGKRFRWHSGTRCP